MYYSLKWDKGEEKMREKDYSKRARGRKEKRKKKVKQQTGTKEKRRVQDC